jgi:hypothetical protein
MKIPRSIDVKYEYTNDPCKASCWLQDIPDTFAADLETAIRYSQEEVKEAKLKAADTSLPKKEQIYNQSIANATALGHPYHCTITHCSIASEEDFGRVFIIDSQDIADVVLDFLTTTDKTQVWHRYAYDGRFIKYYGGQQPKNVQDTQIFAKTLVNHVEVFKASTGLKDLAGAWYGDWGISSEHFTLEQQYEPKVIKYAAIDACATFKLWRYLNEFIGKTS